VRPSASPSTASPSETPSTSPTTAAPTIGPTAASFPPAGIDFDFEGLYEYISDDIPAEVNAAEGNIPRGWTITGVAQVKNSSYKGAIMDNWNGYEGQQYFLIAGNKTEGQASTYPFKLPLSVKFLKFFRLGTERTNRSYLEVKTHEGDSVCKSSNEDGGDQSTFYEEKCDISSAAGKYVIINVHSSGIGTYAIDDIRFEDVNGDIFGNNQYTLDLNRNVRHDEGECIGEGEGYAPIGNSAHGTYTCNSGEFAWVLPFSFPGDARFVFVIQFSGDAKFYMRDRNQKAHALDLCKSAGTCGETKTVTFSIERNSEVILIMMNGVRWERSFELQGIIEEVGLVPASTNDPIKLYSMTANSFTAY